MRFNLLRYYSLASAVVVVAATVILAIFYDRHETDSLVTSVERQNVILASFVANDLSALLHEHFKNGIHDAEDLATARHKQNIKDIDARLKDLLKSLPVLKVKAYHDDLTIYSTEHSQIGEIKSSPGFLIALNQGIPVSKLSFRGKFNTFEGVISNRNIVETYVPVGAFKIMTGESSRFIVEIYTDVTPLVTEIEQSRVNLVAGLIFLLAAFYGVLFLIVRRADKVIDRQYENLNCEITERKKAEEVLREREERLRTIAANLPGGIIRRVLKPDGMLYYDFVSEGIHEVFGIDPQELKADATVLKKHIHPDDYERLWEALRRSAESLEDMEIEARVLMPDGQVKCAHSLTRPRRLENGDVVFDGVVLDITERKQAEEARRESEDRLRGAIESLQEGFVLYDADDRIVMINEVYRQMNPKADEFLEKSMRFEDLLRANVERGWIPEAIGREEEFIREWLEQHRNPKGPILRQTDDGKWYVIKETRTPEGGTAVTFADITGLKATEEALKESEERFKDYAHTSSDYFFEMDENLRFSYFSDRFTEVTGVSAEELLGKTRQETGIPDVDDKEWRRHLADLEAHRPFRNFIHPRTHPDGQVVYLSISGMPVFDAGGNFMCYRCTGTDITELKHTEEALRKSETLFRAVVDHSPAKIHIKDVDGRYMLINKEAERLYGVTDEEGRGKTPYDLFPKEVADAFMVHDRAAIVSGEAVEEEEEFTLDDGVRTYLTVKFPIYDLGGISAIGAIGTDITERKMAEQAMRESEETVKAILNNTAEGIITINEAGLIESFNPAAEDLFGYRTDEVIGQNVSVLMPEPERRAHDGYIKNYLRTGEGKILGVRVRELMAVKKDGAEFPIELNVNKFFLGDQRQFIGSIRDVTERKEAEAALRKLSSAVEQSPASVVITDTEGTIEYVNPKFSEVTGYSAEEAIGQNPRILKSGKTPAAVYEKLWATIKSGKGWRGTLRNKRKDGTMYIAGVSITPITAPDGTVTHFVDAMQDITQRVEDERHLKQAEKMESLGGLAGGIAHDFNNMLLPILLLTDMTRKSLPEDSRERLRLDKVIEAATRAKDLVARILAFSRQEDAKRENIDIHAAIHETMDLLRSTVLTTIKVKQRLKRDTGTVFADPAQMASVLLNLVSNAADAMEGKTGEITVSLSPVKVGKKKAASIPGLRQGKFAKLAVKDDGHGMDEETLDRVMDPFFTTKPVGEGTGLGLSMVHGIVSKHGGAVNISSAPGKGTTIEVYLPLVEREAGPASRNGDDVSGDVRKSAGSSHQPETAMEKPARKH